MYLFVARSPGLIYKFRASVCGDKREINLYLSEFLDRFLVLKQKSSSGALPLFSPLSVPVYTLLHPRAMLYTLFFDTAPMSNEKFCIALGLNKHIDGVPCALYVGLISVLLEENRNFMCDDYSYIAAAHSTVLC